MAERAKPEPFYMNTWWPLEVAIAWVATGDMPFCQKIANLVEERRSHPQKRYPGLGQRLAAQQGLASTYESRLGALYRKSIRGDWKPEGGGPHPWDRTIAETTRILRGNRYNVGGRNISTRKLAKGISSAGGETANGIPARTWASAPIVDDRRLGVILQEDEARGATVWRHIDVQAEPFRKELGGDRGRQTISQREPNPRSLIEKNDRIKKKLAQQDAKMGRTPKKARGRPKGSKNVH